MRIYRRWTKQGWTPFPNSIIDDLMPLLTDTAFRILTVVVRQTLGRKDGESGKRKVMDWLSQSQLKQKTGRQSAAISRALASLIDARYLVACDASLRVLPTKKSRRSLRQPMYLSIGPRLLSYPQQTRRNTISEYTKANTTKK
jgi:hypothetical protein